MLGSVETAVKMYKYLFLNLNFIPSVVSHPIIVHLGEQKMRLNADSGVLYATSNIEHRASIVPFEYGSIHLLILNNACVFVVVVFLCLKIDDLLFYLPSIVGTSFALIIQTHARCDVLERAIDAEKEESQSIDQEMSTKSRITLSNCNALLILSEISAKLDRFDPLTIRRLPFSCITFSPNKWWISHKRRMFIPVKFLQKHFFFFKWKVLDSFFYLIKWWIYFTWLDWSQTGRHLDRDSHWKFQWNYHQTECCQWSLELVLRQWQYRFHNIMDIHRLIDRLSTRTAQSHFEWKPMTSFCWQMELVIRKHLW